MPDVHPLFLPAPYQDAAASGRLILRDASTATVRLTTPADLEGLTALFQRLSTKSRRHRFFSTEGPGPELFRSLCDSSHPEKQLTLVVSRTSAGREEIVATGS